MKRKILPMIMGGLVTVSISIALAQESGNEKPVIDLIPLEQRYEGCINNPDCTAQEQWLIMEEMHNEMHRTFDDMNRVCNEMDYRDCIGPAAQEREQWHKIHTHLKEMMRVMEADFESKSMNTTAEDVEQTEPAAGEEEPWWRRWPENTAW